MVQGTFIVTPGYMIFMAFMLVAFGAMIAAWLRMVLFFRRNKQPEQSSINPLDGLKLWKQFLTSGGFGEEAEPKRRSIVRTYMLAIGAFVFAIILFLTLPGMPR